MEIVLEVSTSASGSEERKHSARKQDHRSYHRAPRGRGEATTDRCRCDKGEAHNRDRQNEKKKPHTAGCNRHVDNTLVPTLRGRLDEGTYALVYQVGAEEQPHKR